MRPKLEDPLQLRYPVSGLWSLKKHRIFDAVFFSILQEFVRAAGFIRLALAVNDSSAGQVIR